MTPVPERQQVDTDLATDRVTSTNYFANDCTKTPDADWVTHTHTHIDLGNDPSQEEETLRLPHWGKVKPTPGLWGRPC